VNDIHAKNASADAAFALIYFLVLIQFSETDA